MDAREVDLDAGLPLPSRQIESGQAWKIHQLGLNFLAAGYQEHARIRLAEAIDYLQAFGSLNIVVTIIAIVSLLLFYYITYRPMIRRLDSEIKKVRILLLLFPDEVARNVPAVLNYSRNLLAMKDSDAVAAAATHM